METLSDFHFLRPYWLLAFIILFFVNVQLRQCRQQQSSWRNICDPLLLKALLLGHAKKDPKLPFILLFTAWSLGILALAGPTWSKSPKLQFREDAARVLILDMSRSMLAQDIKPNRFTRAKHKITDILDAAYSGETALIVFAHDAFVVTPLTRDVNNIRALLPVLTPSIMPVQGSQLSLALAQALQLLAAVNAGQGHIILLTDHAQEADFRLAKRIKALGYRLSVLAVAADSLVKIPAQDGQWLQHRGAIVAVAFDPVTLRRLVFEGGGHYSTITTQNDDVDYLLRGFAAAQTYQPDTARAQVWLEQGPWLLLILLPLALSAFRRGWFGLLLLGFVPVGPFDSVAYASPFTDLWFNKNQQGAIAYAAKQPLAAAQLFEQSAWRGVAWYRAGKYLQAEAAFAQLDTVDAQYNSGNALAHSGRLRAAIQAYQAVLALVPKHADAIYNKKLLEDYLAQQLDTAQQDQDSVADGDDQSSTPDEQGSDAQEYADAGQQPESAGTAKVPSATEQWLQHIPDHPGHLLQRKFLWQSQQKKTQSDDVAQPW